MACEARRGIGNAFAIAAASGCGGVGGCGLLCHRLRLLRAERTGSAPTAPSAGLDALHGKQSVLPGSERHHSASSSVAGTATTASVTTHSVLRVEVSDGCDGRVVRRHELRRSAVAPRSALRICQSSTQRTGRNRGYTRMPLRFPLLPSMFSVAFLGLVSGHEARSVGHVRSLGRSLGGPGRTSPAHACVGTGGGAGRGSAGRLQAVAARGEERRHHLSRSTSRRPRAGTVPTSGFARRSP